MIDYTRWITVYLSLWFSCPRFSRGYHARWRVRHLLPKWRLLPKCVIAHVSWHGLHLLPKWRPTRAHKKSRTQFFAEWVIWYYLSSVTWTSKTTWKWRQKGVAYPYMGTTLHFHVVFDVRVLNLNLSIYKVFNVSKINYNNTMMTALKCFWKLLHL